MLHKGMSKSQVEEELKDKGDFVKIDYLTKFLREELSLDLKKFVCLKLGELYEKTGMIDNASKMFDNAAGVSVAYSEKIKWYLKETELCIRTGNFEKVDEVVKKAMNQANASQKAEIFFQIKRFYLRQAEIYEMEVMRNKASKIYEKLLKMRLSSHEEKEIKEKLTLLYEKLGKFKEKELLDYSRKEGF